MATTASPTSERPHGAAKRYIYAWGDGARRGRRHDARPARRQGRGPRRDDQGRPADPARVHHHDRGLQRLLRRRRAAPRRALGRRPRGGQGGRARDRQGLRRPGQPAARERPLGRQVLDARDDGHGPQPRPQRADAAGPHRADRQRALRLGRLPALHPDVRAHRHGRHRRALRPRPRGGQGSATARSRTRTSTRPPCATSSTEFKAIVKADTGRDFPDDPNEQLDLAIKAVFASWFGKRANDYRKNQGIADDLGHGRQRRDDGLRQHGRRLGHRRRVHPRPEHRREGALRRVPHQRPGRGRRGRHPDRARRSPRWQTEMPEVYAEFQRIGQQLETPLPRRPGPRVHDRARPPVHAPDAQRQADRRGGRADRRRHGRRGHDHQGGGDRPHRAGPRRPAPARPVRPGRRSRPRPRSRNGLNASPGAAVGRAVFDADTAVEWVERGEKVVLVRIETSPDDFHGMAVAAGHPHRPWWGDQPRRGRRPPDRQAVRRRVAPSSSIDYAREAGRQQRDRPSRSRRATGSASTARPAQVYLGALPDRRAPGSRTSPTSRRSSAGPTRSGAWASGPTPTSPRRPPRPAAYGAAGHRPVPDRAHVPRGRAARDRARRDPRRQPGDPGQGQGRRRRDADAPTSSEAVERFDAAMGKLEVLQQGDFEGIFEAMDGLPVVIRLIDPPLHEFLPNLEEQLVKVTRAEAAGGAPARRTRSCSRRSSRCTSRTRCSGLRGCRLGLMIPDFVKIQTRAILNAQIAVKQARRQPDRQDHDPARRPRERAAGDQARCSRPRPRPSRPRRAGVERRLQVRHDDRGPARRADRRRDRQARPTFFSFGTNDLTQMTFGYSRDDAEGGFLLKYVEDGILPVNPFQTLDDAVAGLMQVAVDKGRADAPGPRARHLRRARRRPGVDPQVRGDRARLRVVLAVPRPGRATGRRPGGPGQRRRTRQVAS